MRVASTPLKETTAARMSELVMVSMSLRQRRR
jgi:hypothetical protein